MRPFLAAARGAARLIGLRTGLLTGLLLAAFAAGSAAAAEGPGLPPNPGQETERRRGVIGEPPPDVSLRDLAGNRVSLRGFEGKVVVFDFWAVWCGPCRVSLPFFQEMEDRYRGEGLVVVGLHVDDGLPADEEVQAFLDEYGVTYTNLISTVEADEGFRVSLVPTTYLTDRSGLVRKRHLGFHPERTPPRLEEEIRALLGLE